MIKLHANKIKIIVFTLFAMMLGSCGQQKSDSDPRKLKTSSALDPGESSNWIQVGVLGSFTIYERSVVGSDGCNGFHHGRDEYFIFAPGGEIVSNAHFASTKKSCQDRGPVLSSFPRDGWKSWALSNGELIITTENGETHRFSRDLQKH